ncbi:hypothetical protein D3C81_843260 [compost metagenome]
MPCAAASSRVLTAGTPAWVTLPRTIRCSGAGTSPTRPSGSNCVSRPSAASTSNRAHWCGPCWGRAPMAASACCWLSIIWWWTGSPGVSCSKTCRTPTPACARARPRRCRREPARCRPGPCICRTMPVAAQAASWSSGTRNCRTSTRPCRWPALAPAGLTRTPASSGLPWTPRPPGACCNRRRRPTVRASTTCC